MIEAFYLPEHCVGVGSFEEFSVLKGDHVVRRRVDEERDPFFPEARGVLRGSHVRPDALRSVFQTRSRLSKTSSKRSVIVMHITRKQPGRSDDVSALHHW